MTPGQKLIAKRSSDSPKLTANKQYQVVTVMGEVGMADRFYIIDDEGQYCDFFEGEKDSILHISPSFGTWYPIESAPKDGTEILVLDYAGNQSVAKWVDGKDVEDRSTAGNMKYWQGVCCGWNVWTGRDELYFECEKITHWTPLPELPKE